MLSLLSCVLFNSTSEHPKVRFKSSIVRYYARRDSNMIPTGAGNCSTKRRSVKSAVAEQQHFPKSPRLQSGRTSMIICKMVSNGIRQSLLVALYCRRFEGTTKVSTNRYTRVLCGKWSMYTIPRHHLVVSCSFRFRCPRQSDLTKTTSLCRATV